MNEGTSVASLDELLNQPHTWQGYAPDSQNPGLSSGYASLDNYLPGNGFPQGALTELLLPDSASGALRFLLPLLKQASSEGHWLAMVAPPYSPYAPALAAAGIDLSRLLCIDSDLEAGSTSGSRSDQRLKKNRWWAAEQLLSSGEVKVVLIWPDSIPYQALRRLQLAAEAGNCLGILLRNTQERQQSSPSSLRLSLEQGPFGFKVDIVKCKGRHQLPALQLPLTA